MQLHIQDLAQLLQHNKVPAFLAFYATPSSSQIRCPERFLSFINDYNRACSDQTYLFSDEVFELVSRNANDAQWVAFFFNIFLRGPLRSRGANADKRSQIVNCHSPVFEPFLSAIPAAYARKDPQVSGSLTNLLSRVLQVSSIAESDALIRVVVDCLNPCSARLIDEICHASEDAVRLCQSLEVGPMLVPLVTQTDSRLQQDAIFRALKYLPCPEVVGLVNVRHSPSSSSHAYRGFGSPVTEMLVVSSIFGFVPFSDTGVSADTSVLGRLMTWLLLRGRAAVVLSFAEQTGAMANLVSEIGLGVSTYAPMLIENHANILTRLLVNPKSAGEAMSICRRLVNANNLETRQKILDNLSKSLDNLGGQLIPALMLLGFKPGEEIWRAVDQIPPPAPPGFIDLVCSMDAAQIQPHFATVLRFVNKNPEPLKDFMIVAKGLSDDVVDSPEWAEFCGLLQKATILRLRSLLPSIWRFPALRASLEPVIIPEGKPFSPELTEFICDYRIRPETFVRFLRFLATKIAIRSSDLPKVAMRIAHDSPRFDFSQVEIDIPPLLTYFAANGYQPHLIQVVGIIARQNEEFGEVLSEELTTLISRDQPCAYAVMLQSELFGDASFGILDKHVEVLKRWKDDVATNDYLFGYYQQKRLEPKVLSLKLFASSSLHSTTEKNLFRQGLGGLTEEELKPFVTGVIKSMNPLTSRRIDFKRIWFLVKIFPEQGEEILRMTGWNRNRTLMIAKARPEIAKYARKLFGFTDEEYTQIETKQVTNVPSKHPPKP
jgi:hypothetical protein